MVKVATVAAVTMMVLVQAGWQARGWMAVVVPLTEDANDDAQAKEAGRHGMKAGS